MYRADSVRHEWLRRTDSAELLRGGGDVELLLLFVKLCVSAVSFRYFGDRSGLQKNGNKVM